jgi:hypothetical protein
MRENRTSGSMRGEGDDLRVALSLLLYRARPNSGSSVAAAIAAP